MDTGIGCFTKREMAGTAEERARPRDVLQTLVKALVVVLIAEAEKAYPHSSSVIALTLLV
jgi:hypothetical protein